MKFEILKYCIVRNESYQRSVLSAGLCFLIFFDQKTSFKFSRFFFAFANGCYFQANTLLKNFAVKFGACVHLAYYIDNLAEGNTSTIVTHRYLFALNGKFNGLTITHSKFIDAIIDHLFCKHINPIIGTAAISQLSDVHAGAHTNVLFPIERADTFFGIIEKVCCCRL